LEVAEDAARGIDSDIYVGSTEGSNDEVIGTRLTRREITSVFAIKIQSHVAVTVSSDIDGRLRSRGVDAGVTRQVDDGGVGLTFNIVRHLDSLEIDSRLEVVGHANLNKAANVLEPKGIALGVGNHGHVNLLDTGLGTIALVARNNHTGLIGVGDVRIGIGINNAGGEDGAVNIIARVVHLQDGVAILEVESKNAIVHISAVASDQLEIVSGIVNLNKVSLGSGVTGLLEMGGQHNAINFVFLARAESEYRGCQEAERYAYSFHICIFLFKVINSN
jgi:hypothetical protein